MGVLKVFRAERVQLGAGDLDFLQRVFHKLLLNLAWWINRKDADGHNLFEGGCLGLDNISVYSWVGLIPLFAAEVVDRRLLATAPRFAELLRAHKGGLFRGNFVCLCPDWENDRGEHLLALVDQSMLPRILERLLDEEQFLSPFGVRSVSRVHATQTRLGQIPGIGDALMQYVPGESNSPLFGGNSNWRGRVWLPTNYPLIHALEKYHRFPGPGRWTAAR
jgi:hypothetical protein